MNQYYTPKRKIVGSTQTSLDPCHPIILYDLNDQTENSSWGGQHKWLKINTTVLFQNNFHQVGSISPLFNSYQIRCCPPPPYLFRHQGFPVADYRVHRHIEDGGQQWVALCDTSLSAEGFSVVPSHLCHHLNPLPITAE